MCFPGGEGVDEDRAMELALEAGAEDVRDESDVWELHCTPGDFNSVLEALKAVGQEPESAEVTMLPSTSVAVGARSGSQLLSVAQSPVVPSQMRASLALRVRMTLSFGAFSTNSV